MSLIGPVPQLFYLFRDLLCSQDGLELLILLLFLNVGMTSVCCHTLCMGAGVRAQGFVHAIEATEATH